MTQGCTRTGLCLHIAHTGKVLIVLCPPSGMGQTDIDALIVHILGLDDDGTMIGRRLLGLTKSRFRQVVGETVGTLAGTGNRDGGRTHVLHTHTVGLRSGIIGLANERRTIGSGARLVFLQRCGGLGGSTRNIDGIGTHRQRITAVVVQIEFDTVGILTDHTAGEVVVVELQRVAGVILQGNGTHRMLILI